MIDIVRVSEKGKIQLITLKRRTGIQNWNSLCRWALCVSLKEDSEPPNEEIPSDSSIEMTWKTFTGGDEEIYLALVKFRAHNAGIALKIALRYPTSPVLFPQSPLNLATPRG